MTTILQWLVTFVVLYCMPDFMCCDRNRSQRMASEFVRRQSNNLVIRIVVVAVFGFLDSDVRHVVFVQQMTSKLTTSARIAIRRFSIAFQYMLHPDARKEYYAQEGQNNDQNTHGLLLYAK